MPAALWLISTTTSPLELFEPTAQERQFGEQLVATLAESQAALVSLHAQAPEVSESVTSHWSDMGGVAKRLFDVFPDQFRVCLCFLCLFAREFGKRLDLGQPTAAELASLLDDLDRRRPFLLPYVLELMAATPSADAVTARWRPPDKSREKFIARKFFTFGRMVFKRLNKGDENSRRLMAELLEVFREHRVSTRETALGTGFFKLPLGTLLMIEQIIDDERLSIPGKVVAVNQLVTGDGPVCH